MWQGQKPTFASRVNYSDVLPHSPLSCRNSPHQKSNSDPAPRHLGNPPCFHLRGTAICSRPCVSAQLPWDLSWVTPSWLLPSFLALLLVEVRDGRFSCCPWGHGWDPASHFRAHLHTASVGSRSPFFCHSIHRADTSAPDAWSILWKGSELLAVNHL